jgi:hypothetical protein
MMSYLTVNLYGWKMKLNIFEGARRIALGIGSLWIVGFVTYNVFVEPIAFMTYAITWPREDFVKSATCDRNDATEHVTAKTSNGKSINVKLCFNAHESNDGRLLVPYAVMPSAKAIKPNPFDQFDPDAYLASKVPKSPLNESVEKSVQGNFWEGDKLVYDPKASEIIKRDIPLKVGKSQAKNLVFPKNDIPENLQNPVSYLVSSQYSTEVKQYTESVAKRFTLPESDMKDAEQHWRDALLAQWIQAIQFIVGGLAALWLAVTSIGWVVRGFMGIKRGKDFIEAD